MKNRAPLISIIFEDDYLLAVDKPSGVLSIPDRFKPELPNVQGWLKNRYEEIFTLHRLDKGSSGILLFAKTAKAHKLVNDAFEKRKVEKTYHALCKGSPPEDKGTIQGKISPHASRAGKMVVNKSGKKATSHYRLLESFGHYHLAEVIIETGRTHQVRVHLQSIGLPLLGDSLYGAGDFFISELKGKKYKLGKYAEERPILQRAALHARELGLIHPITKEKLLLQTEYPKDFNATLKQIRKWKGA